MSSPDARAYSRNKRGIPGSLIWINFDRHSLLNLIQKCAGTFVADIDEIRPQYTDVSNGGAVFSSSVVRSSGHACRCDHRSAGQHSDTLAGQNTQLATPWYSDQVLPFDITLSGANEYGTMCAAKIYGLEILNEGLTIFIDDAARIRVVVLGLSVGSLGYLIANEQLLTRKIGGRVLIPHSELVRFSRGDHFGLISKAV